MPTIEEMTSKDNKYCQRRAEIMRTVGELKTPNARLLWACNDWIFDEDIPEGQSWRCVREERIEEWHEAARMEAEDYKTSCMESYYGVDDYDGW